jgi:hypothetical protein
MDEPYEPQAQPQPRTEARPEPKVQYTAPRRGLLLGGSK